jgi:aldose 1-epimerase
VAASGAQWTIQRGNQIAVVVEVGGGLRSYSVDGEDIVDGYGEDELAPGAAGQILFPWPNRLRDGAFRFDGEFHQLPLTEPGLHNAIHGLVRWVPWRANGIMSDSVTMEYKLHPQPGYPWALLLKAKYTVGLNGLRVTHTVHNLSETPAPFGIGAHPYVRIPGVPINDLELCVPARTRLLVDGRLLPIGAAKVAGGEFDFTTSRRLGSMELNVALGDLLRDHEGRSEVTLSAADGRTVQVWADQGFKWWQLYTGEALTGQRRRRAIGVEPMTCPPDALRSGRDLITLDPGEKWSGQWGISRMMGLASSKLLERLA